MSTWAYTKLVQDTKMIKWLIKKQWSGEKQCCELKGVMAEEMVSESYNKIFCDKAKMYI